MFQDEQTWARLDPAERQRVIDRILDTLDEYREAMSEGVRHQRRKTGIAAELEGTSAAPGARCSSRASSPCCTPASR